MSGRKIPTMEQCIDRHCMCITRNSPQGYHGLSPEYQRKLTAIQAELQADYDARMASAEKAMDDFSRSMNWLIGGIALALCLIAWSAFAQPVHVTDGDTLKLNGTTYRLHGIDAPEKSQVCDNGWLAGEYAAAVLRGLVDARFVICIPRTTDRYGRTVAICLADGVDVGAEMVRQGMAWAFTRYSTSYVDLEAAAKAERLGVHLNGCQPAWDYRKEKRQ